MKISQLTTVGYPPNFDINIYTPQGKIALCGIETMTGQAPIGLDYCFQVFSNIRKDNIELSFVTTEHPESLTNTVKMTLDKPDALENMEYTVVCKFVRGVGGNKDSKVAEHQ